MANVTLMDSVVGTYATFSGCDAIATFNNQVIGELQAITLNISRETAPNYVLGNPNPIAFSRGKRGIAGTMVFLTFDRNQLQDTIKQTMGTQSVGFTSQYGPTNGTGATSDWNNFANGGLSTVNVFGTTNENYNAIVNNALASNSALGGFRILNANTINYEDQLPPFDVTITFANEYGSMANMAIYKVQLINEGMGISVDDLVLERSCTFVARAVQQIKPGPKVGGIGQYDNTPGKPTYYNTQLGLAGYTPLGSGIAATGTGFGLNLGGLGSGILAGP